MQPAGWVARVFILSVLLAIAAPAALADNAVTATKSVSGTFVQGTNVTYTIVIANDMAVAQNDNFGHEFTDLLPSQLMFVSADASSGTAQYFTTIGVLVWNGSIPAGGTVTLTVVCTIDPTASGTISNQGQTIFDGDNDNSNESSHVTDDPSTAAVDDATSFNVIQTGEVLATKSVSGTFVQGTDVTYTIVMTNNMTVAQPNEYAHEFTDVLPSGLTLVSTSATSGTAGSCCGNVVFWDGALAAGESVTLTIVATIDPAAGGTISNQGQTLFSRDGDEHYESSHVTDDPSTAEVDDATSFNVVQSGHVSATKSVSGTFVQGTNVTYTIVLTNNMTVEQPDNYANESVDLLPSGVTLVSAEASSGAILLVPSGNAVTWNGSIPAGGSVTYTIVATISPTASGTISNQAYAYDDSNGDGHNDRFWLSDDPSTAAVDDATSFNVIQSGEVTATKSVSGTFVQGTNVTYTIVMTNNMTVAQNDNFGHEFTDTLPSGLTYVSANATSGTATHCCGNPGLVLWNGSIPAGGSVTITIVATIDATASGTISNQAHTIFDRNGDNQNESEWFSDPTSFNVVQSGEVLSTMSVSGTFVQGTNVTYTIVMTNNMTVTQPDNFGHEWTDNLPSGLTFVSATATSGTIVKCCGNPGIVFWDGSIPSSGSVTLTFTATISATASGAISNQGQTIFDRDGDNENESSHLTDDPSTAAVDDATSFNVVQSGEVLSTMSVSGTFVQGTTVTYTIVMTNNMTVTQPDNFGHEWTDILPSGLTLVGGSATSGTVGQVSNIIFWDGSIPSGGSVTLTFTATISATASGAISNQGQTIFDRNGDNQNESSHLTDDPSTAAVDDATSFNVIQANEVLSTMSVSGTFVQGTTVTYTVVMTNNMTVTQPDNFGHEWTDILPSGLTLVGGSATNGTVGQVSNIIFWDGSIASGGSVTLTFTATISSTAAGTISNQGQTIFDRDGDNENESSHLTDDPSTAAVDDATSFNVIQANEVLSTMSVSGTFVQGTTVTYTVVMTNNMTVTQPDNFGHEWTDILPSGLTLVGGSASSGTVGQVANIIFWDGSIPSGGSVTLTFTATISSTASGAISNQGQTIFDRDGDNQNESSHLTDDPSTAAVDDATSFNVIQSGEVTATKTVSGTFVQGTNVTYTIAMTNNMTVTQPDNFGHEFTDTLPSGLTYVSANATSGTATHCCGNPGLVLWNGSIPAGGSVTITIVATIDATASGTISNQAHTIFDRNSDNQNESEWFSDATSFNVVQSGEILSTKSVSGTFVQGTNVTYTVVMTNNMTVAQPDNFGHEWTDNLPSGLTFVSATATSGTIVKCCGDPGIVFWDGSIPSGGSVTLTFTATISSTASGTISNQGQTIFDRDGDNENESSHLTDDPSTAAVDDATTFTVIANQADLSLTMTYVPANPGQNENVTYTLVVANGGPLTATNVVVTDDVPNDATFLSVSSTQGSCTASDPVVCSVGTLASGASATMTLLVKTPGSYSSMTNSATATADQPDPTAATASATFNCMKLKKGVLKPCSN